MPTEEDPSTFVTDYELYVLRQDLKVNPIPERADELREQAADEGGLCSIQIPAYTEADTTDSYLSTVVSSVTASAQCSIDVCRSEGCHVCTDEGGNATCVPCSASSDCDGLANVIEYRFCECDVVITVNENNEFTLYTGKEVSMIKQKHLPFPLADIVILTKYHTRQMSQIPMTSN